MNFTLALALLLPIASSAAPDAPKGGDIVDRVAATVNGDVVTLSDLQERAGTEWVRVEHMDPGPARDAARKAALRRAFDLIVAEKLLAKEAEVLQLEVTEAQIDAAIADIKTRNHFDEAQLDRALAEQGLDRPAFRSQVRRELETYQVLQYKVRNRVKLSDADVENYYRAHPQEFGGEEELRVRHLFLPLAEGASAGEEERVRGQMARVLQRLETGEDFAKVAREVSKGPSAAEGGDIGWLRRGTVQKQLEDAAFALKDGQISRVVRAGPGLHLLKVEARRTGGGKSFKEAQEEIRTRLYEEQVSSYRQAYIEELKKGAVIDLKLPELKS